MEQINLKAQLEDIATRMYEIGKVLAVYSLMEQDTTTPKRRGNFAYFCGQFAVAHDVVMNICHTEKKLLLPVAFGPSHEQPDPPDDEPKDGPSIMGLDTPFKM